jgi:hypothetical protein
MRRTGLFSAAVLLALAACSDPMEPYDDAVMEPNVDAPLTARVSGGECEPVVGKAADLVITAPATLTVMPSMVERGGTIQLPSWTVANQGTVGTRSFSNGIYLSTDATITAADRLLDGNWNEGLAPGASFNWPRQTLTIPTNIPVTNYYIGILVDDTNTTPEACEGNNFKSTPLKVWIPISPYYVPVPGDQRSEPSEDGNDYFAFDGANNYEGTLYYPLTAQTVTAGMDGALVQVQLPGLYCSDTSQWTGIPLSGSLVVEIQGVKNWNGWVVPDMTVLASESIPLVDLAVSRLEALTRDIDIVFSSPASFAAGEQFAIVLKNTGNNRCAVRLGLPGDPYARGGAVYSDTFYQQPGYSGTWVDIGPTAYFPSDDLAFVTFVEPTS